MTPFSGHALVAPWLRLASVAYGAALRARDRRYGDPARVRRAGLPVISVGNLTVGGTGKTPVVAWLARRLRQDGRSVAVISRGYGGSAGRGPLVVSDGSGPTCAASVCGDEPFLHARTLAEVVVVVGSDRHAAACAALRLGADIAVLDDGFQHRGLHRDLDVVLLHGEEPFGNGWLLPAGPLREPREALARAGVLLLTRTAIDEPRTALAAELRRWNAAAPILRADHRISGFVDATGAPVEPPRRAVAFCGIGDPARFHSDLAAAAVEVVDFRVWRDHHRFAAAEIAGLARAARAHDCALVTTEKDLARLGDSLPAACAARIEAVIHEPAALLAAVARAGAVRAA